MTKAILSLFALMVPMASAESLLPANWDPALAGDIVMQRLIHVTAPQVKGAHDAEFVCVGERAYIVEHDNDVSPGHGAGAAMYCVLTVVNLKTLQVEKTHLLAKAGQAFANVTLPEAQVFVPRIIRKDEHTLRTYFCSKSASELTWYRDFDLRTQSFEDSIHKAKLKTAAGTFDMEPIHFHADAAAQGFKRPAVNHGLYIFDSFKEFDGRRYVALNNFPGKQNALAVLLDDFATFEIIGHYNEPQSQQLSESAVNRLPDGTWMAIVRNDAGNYHFTTSQDGKTWTVAEPKPFVPNGLNSKPTFDKFGGVYYLGWQENTKIQNCNRSVFNVDISRDGKTWQRKYRFESPHSFQYPTFHEHEGTLWLTVSQSDHGGSTDRIMFGKLEAVGEFEPQTGQTHAQGLVPSNWDHELAGDIVMQRLVKITAPKVKGTHDAEFVCIGDRAYVVTEANDQRAGESSAWPFIYVTMSIVNLKTLEVEKVIDFARSEQIYENETLPFGQCFVPRILQKDAKTLRCYFTSQDPGKRQAQMWYIDFDLGRAEFENRIYRAKLKTAAGTFDMQPQPFYDDAAKQGFRRPARDAGLFIFDSFKQFDGKTYVALNNFPVGQNALALLHDDLVTFEVIGHYNEPQTQQLSESAVNRLPDGTWMAIVRNDKGNYHFTTSADGKKWTVGTELPFVKGSNSKPTFDKFGEVYYLGWQDAEVINGDRRTIFNIDISRDGKTWERKYRFVTPHSFQYPTLHEHQGTIWLSVTQGTQKDRIMFGKLESVGQFEPQSGRKRIEWPPVLPKGLAKLNPGEKLFTDREYVSDEIPAEVRDRLFLRTSIEKCAIEVKKPGVLYALTPTIRPDAASQDTALLRQGFTKVNVPEVQLFPGEINRVSLYQKTAKSGERLRFTKMVVLIMGDGCEIGLYEPKAPNPWPTNNGEKLYNSIVLPKVWPPEHYDQDSAEPMPVPYVQHPPKVIPIDVGRQLFVDDFLIESSTLKRTFHTATKFSGNPVFKAETKHELGSSGGAEGAQEAVTYLGHGGVFYDPSAKLFKMFYTAGWRGPLALATSPDLKTWTRPSLGIREDNLLRDKGNEAGGDNCVWLDLASQDARIKFMTDRGKLGHQLQTSADGREWAQPVFTGPAGDYCSFFFNPFRERWVYSIKQGSKQGRNRWYHESRDFIAGADWSKSVFWANADRLDLPDPQIGKPAQLYSLSAVAYESVMLGMFQIHLGPDNKVCDAGKFPKVTELKVGFSRDGFHWDRSDRRAFIAATRREGDWDRAYLHTTAGVCVVLDDQLVFPYCAYSGIAPNGHRGMYCGGSIGLATLRRDGFASMEGPGDLTTRPVQFKGKHLFVNVNGEMRVEVLDEAGKVIRTSKPASGDQTKLKIEWQDGADLSDMAGQAVKFRFQVTKGSLYAFWVTPDEKGSSQGFVGAGGPGFAGTRDD